MPNITIGPLVVAALRPVTDLPLDVHLVSCLGLFFRSIALSPVGIVLGAPAAFLKSSIPPASPQCRCSCLLQMIVEPEARVADFAKAGADIISVHVESKATTHLDRVIHQVPLLPRVWTPVSADPIARRTQCRLNIWAGIWHPASNICRVASNIRGMESCMTVLHAEGLLMGCHPALLQIKDLGCKAGIVLNPATPLSAIEHVLSFVGEPRLYFLVPVACLPLVE